ncbi:Peptide methionine sulfoxide reductase MsrA [Candidatus Nitrosocosmicus franklandus]|uniref:Peptide methionine sulfoxide reductase MsrA n=2 Tax=Candidatus Nitrosocosmicus franklandianus TaxID=1798806 RepID=A0A484I819_9ARCH|nr:Peptide methionine sulfoxide reductase MsrA [Candidatus Nitrosocosmicus franklandus]
MSCFVHLFGKSLSPYSATSKSNKVRVCSIVMSNSAEISGDLEVVTLASGCFWCTEAVFKRIKGVVSAVPGYAGGSVNNPTYEQVCSGTTGHAEAVQVQFDPNIISLEQILEIFFYTHDPTTLNRQGNDVGTQYRSVIFYHSERQKDIAYKIKSDLDKKGIYANPIVTEITTFSNFYQAEDYHKDYYDNNRSAPYCNYVIDPKVNKLLTKFSTKLKHEYLRH